MIYILLPVHNRKAITEKLILCLKRQTVQSFQVVLIDDGSTDGTREMVASHLPATAVLYGKGDWWWGGSLQQGYDWLSRNAVHGNDLVLIINDDVECEADYLERAQALLATKQRVLLLSQCRDAEGRVVESGVHVDLDRLTFEPAHAQREINCLSTRGLFLRWSDMKAIGGFRPRLLPHYLSDYEFTIRAWRKGFRCETDPSLYVIPDFETTGFHAVTEKSFKTFMKKYFSKKSAGNPVYWSIFVLLASNRRRVVRNLLTTWREAFRTIRRAYSMSKAGA